MSRATKQSNLRNTKSVKSTKSKAFESKPSMPIFNQQRLVLGSERSLIRQISYHNEPNSVQSDQKSQN